MNKSLACLAVAAIGFLGIAAAREEAGNKELEAFTGKWKCVAATKDGKVAPEERVAKISLSVKGGKYVFTGSDGKAIEGTHKLDPSKKPKEIDAVRSSGEGKGEKILGIYELGKDTYKVCLAPPGKERPTEFVSKAGTGHRLLVFKREKD